MDFYYEALNGKLKAVYETFYRGILGGRDTIYVTEAQTIEEVKTVVMALDYDKPELFYLNFSEISCTKRSNTPGITWKVPYQVSAPKRAGQIRAMETKIQNALRRMQIRRTDTDIMIYHKVHDYLVRNVTYNQKALRQQNPDRSVYTIQGVLEQQSAVCEGIAKAFKLLCERAGAKDVVLLTGMSARDEKSAPGPHAWNAVRTKAGWAHIDTTWDLCLTTPDARIRWDYFLIPDDWIRTDHNFTAKLACRDSSESYFARNECLFGSGSQVRQYLDAEFRKNTATVSLYFKVATRGGVPTVTEKQIENLVRETIQKRLRASCTYTVSRNAAQNIYSYLIQKK